MAARPVIIYVSGAPGSGKTTLAERISKELFIPHVSSDMVHGGARLTIGVPNNRHKTLHEAFVPLMLSFVELGISFVVDHVLQKGLSEQHILDKITPKANVIIIHTYCENPIDRHLKRELSREDKGIVLSREARKDRAVYHVANLINTADPIVTDLPLLTVDTNNGYEPEIEKILAFILENTDGYKEKL